MHTSVIHDNEGKEWTVHHNGGWTGDIRFELPKDQLIEARTNEYVEIPFEVLQEIVGRWMIGEKVSELEQLWGKDMLVRLTK